MSLNILCISWGTLGNLSPVLTAARQLRAAGHRVRVMADPAMRAEVETSGFPWVGWCRAPTGRDADPSDASDIQRWLARTVFDPAEAYARDTIDEIQRIPTDAVIHLDMLFGCALGAEAAGVPFAILSPHISIKPLPGLPPAASGMPFPGSDEERATAATACAALVQMLDQPFAPALNAVRRDLGLAEVASCFDVYDRAARVLLAISRSFDFPADRYPANYRYIGPLLDEPGAARAWHSPWSDPAGGRPRILVAGSTGDQNQADLLRRVVRALGTLEVEAIVTTGLHVRAEELPAPDNVHVVETAPHNSVMREVDMVVSQGGHGTVTRALINGLPLLVAPMGRDQADNAARVEARGAGLRLAPDAAEVEIADAVRQLLTEPRFREGAARLGAAIREDVDASRLPREIEAMVAQRRPGATAAERPGFSSAA